ncbi:transcription factor bHLH143-like [Tasmannia lanceolata]|uniref:transcription factor bHLH143-like n=1 Tax=Tasmannia lanceolata TaxID=3420 RepID=UPI00406378B4
MGKDCGPWLYQQHSPWYSPNSNCANIPPNQGQKNANPMMFPSHIASANQTISGFAATELPPIKSVVPDEPQALYYYDAHQKDGGEMSRVSPCSRIATNLGSNTVEKRLLVFDQSGNRRSLIFSSFGPPFQYPNYGNLRPISANGFCAELPTNKDHPIPNVAKTESLCGDSDNTDVEGEHESEIHEDTEELDALLYSDEDDDDEVISTGHSPIEMAGYQNGRKEQFNDIAQAANSVTPTKRRRPDKESDMALMDTASSGNPLGSWNYEDNAEVSCIKGNFQGESASLANKRLKRERIREAVGVLQSIIPGGKGKNPAVVLEEAIKYLRTLKLKAKAIGITTLK